jgi:hypothetical protein
MNPHNYSQLIFDKRSPNTWWRNDSLFNKCCRKYCTPSCRRLKLDLCVSPCISAISKWIKDLNIRHETL